MASHGRRAGGYNAWLSASMESIIECDSEASRRRVE